MLFASSFSLSAQSQKTPQLKTQTVGKKNVEDQETKAKPAPKLYQRTQSVQTKAKPDSPEEKLLKMEANLKGLERKLNALETNSGDVKSDQILRVEKAIADQKKGIETFKKNESLDQ